MTLAICICTYKRPQGLTRLLNALKPLAGRQSFEVFVVDNHSDAEGLQAIATLESTALPFDIHRAQSTANGISHARNQVLQMAMDRGMSFAALIDDDEWPSDCWLDELLRVQMLEDADAIGGPTRAVFDVEPAEELKRSIYYGADLQLPDNAPCTLQACGNVLLKLAPLKKLPQPLFDPELGQSGGEDLAFFMRLQAVGFDMRWAKNAAVSESVPPERSNSTWLRHRVALIANTRVHILRKLEPSLHASLARTIKTIALAGQAIAFSVAGLFDAKMRYNAWVHWAKFHGKTQAHLGRRLERGENH